MAHYPCAEVVKAGDNSSQKDQPEDALNALLALGYSVKEARAALARLDPALAAPDAIRQALKLLSKVA